MNSSNIQRIRVFRFPLLLGLIVSGLMIARVPLNAFTTAPMKSSPVEKQAKVATKEQPTAVELPVEQPLDLVVSETPPAPGATLQLPTFELPDAQKLLHNNRGMLGELMAALPSAADLIPRSSSPTQPAESVAEVTPEEVSAVESSSEVVLRNPSESGGLIRFLIGSQLYELQPGEAVTLAPDQQIQLRFHRGDDFGNADHTLSAAGIYEFTPTAEGWVLSTSE